MSELEKLIAKVKQKDLEAMGELFYQFKPLLKSRARKYSRHGPEYEDVFQQGALLFILADSRGTIHCAPTLLMAIFDSSNPSFQSVLLLVNFLLLIIVTYYAINQWVNCQKGGNKWID